MAAMDDSNEEPSSNSIGAMLGRASGHMKMDKSATLTLDDDSAERS